MDHGDLAWLLISSALVFIMTPGLAFFYGGLVKRKNVINMMMSSAIIMGVGSVMWVLVGFSLSFSGDLGGVIGDLRWAGLNFNTFTDTTLPYPNTLAFAIFQMMFAIIAPALITGAIAERMKFASLVLFMVLWSLIVYYPLAHMVWGGGYLFRIGSVDFAGGNVVHISSGVSALVLSILLGKRKNLGKAPYHPHNIPFVFLGASLLWFGWFGFNGGSALEANELAAHAFMTTNTAAASALLSWVLVEVIKNGKPTLVGASTGLVIGLVAITPGAGFVPVWAAIIIGGLVSPICYFFIDYVKSRFGYDDALDVFGCHGIGGIWGGIATGIFGKTSINPGAAWNGLAFGEAALFLRQLAAIGITIVIAVIGTLIAARLTSLVTKGIKVSKKEEALGLDISEHGETAYPAFNGMD
ncbi:ammonium transporter [Lacrimispora sphenoides]|uniref:Ammonium transporter n=1 Tax=Lacrimispora sphenoides JCM 1415 TaxID=1297793 RepID=A0ABY1CHH4_9FIRM|nr:ammonium transporter [Lacrimispora sphenoides]SEU04635.1 ammonium transporter, Amt family [[Clostridium] sphenoides JCM 1415]SUY48906.1 ammonium transporter [Lacrimispora sphenoides]